MLFGSLIHDYLVLRDFALYGITFITMFIALGVLAILDG
jgi:hypothetical protein